MVVLVVFACAKCDLFQTRTPEAPSQSVSTFDPPTSYDVVLRNLQFAIVEKNVNNYTRCFADTSVRPFVFNAAEDARRGFADVMSHWDLDAEYRYFRNLKEVTAGLPSLSLPDKPPTFVSSDSVVYDLDYTLYFPHVRTGVPKLVRGNMQLYIGADDQHRWAIYYWRDSKTTSDSTWSYLKAVFSGS